MFTPKQNVLIIYLRYIFMCQVVHCSFDAAQILSYTPIWKIAALYEIPYRSIVRNRLLTRSILK